ncbi:MAG: NAD-dependent 4,6-dehydratase LegB [Candidatus Methanoperedens sp.]
MFWQDNKVLVTGAGGFIGSHLVESLVRKKAKVKAFVHYNSRNDWGNLELLPHDVLEKIEIITGDIRDPFCVRNAVKGCDTVFHLGALIAIPYSYLAPKDFVDTNILGTVNIMQACKDENVSKIVHTSTSEVYGTAIYTPINEKHPLQGQSPYSASKIGADMMAQSYYNSFELPVATIRPFNTFGPRQSARAVIPAICSQILSGKKKIHVGLLSPVRDFTFVQDTVNGFLKIAESERSIGEVINIGSGKGISIGDLLKTIIDLIGKDISIISDDERMRPSKSEVMTLLCDNRKARELVGWEPTFTLEDGLKETIKYVQEHLEKYKANIYNV